MPILIFYMMFSIVPMSFSQELPPPPAQSDSAANKVALIFESIDRSAVLIYNTKHAEGVAEAKKAYELAQQSFLPGNPVLAQAEIWYGRSLISTANYDLAEKILKDAINDISLTYGDNDPFLTVALNDLAKVYIASGAYDKAEAPLKKAVKIHELTSQENYERILNNWDSIDKMRGEIQDFRKKNPANNDFLSGTLIFLQRSTNQSQAYTHQYGRTLNRLQQLYRQQKKYLEAAQACDKTVDIFEITDKSNNFTENISRECAENYRLAGDLTLAVDRYKKSLAIIERKYGTESPKAKQVLEALVSILKIQNQMDDVEKYNDIIAGVNAKK